jgi:CopG family nickel-responsive transcriptional regulator
MDERRGRERIGFISVIYNKNSPNALENLTDIQHNFREYINSVLKILGS